MVTLSFCTSQVTIINPDRILDTVSGPLRIGTGAMELKHITRAWHNYDMGSLYIEPDQTWRLIAPIPPGPQRHGTGGEMAMWIRPADTNSGIILEPLLMKVLGTTDTQDAQSMRTLISMRSGQMEIQTSSLLHTSISLIKTEQNFGASLQHE
jgi:hypothetical protein